MKSEEELDELAKAMYRKEAAQKALYEKMSSPVNEDEEIEDDNHTTSDATEKIDE